MASIVQEQDLRPPEPVSVLAPNGTIQPGERVDETPKLLLKMYRWMVFGRLFDTRLLNLQRQGRLVLYAPIAGQEAAQVGSALALQRDDWLFASYRDGLACTIHRLPFENVVLFFRGHPNAGMVPEDVNVFGQQIGIAEQIPHAVGAAWGMKLRGAHTAALTLFGEGATSEGAFHEGSNFAGVMHAPIVLVCQNNQWAISVPRSKQTASQTFAQKALAYGIPSRLVDGNDVLAMYREVRSALAKARNGGGPTMIEAVTYRFGPHSSSDDPQRYRSNAELTEWRDQRDPVTRLRIYLEHVGLWSEERQKELEEEVRADIARGVTAAMSEPVPDPSSMFDHVYANSPALLEAQKEEFQAYLKKTQKGAVFP